MNISSNKMVVKLTQADWDRARTNPLLMPELVKAVDLEDKAQFVSSVEYHSKTIGNGLMLTQPPISSVLGESGGKSRIIILPLARHLQRVQDFLGFLIDHEGAHAELNYKHPRKVVPTVTRETIELVLRKGYLKAFRMINNQGESLAFQNQLANLDKRGRNSEYYAITVLQGLRDSLNLTY